MAFNFPAAPVVGEVYPNPEQPGAPQYTWDGSAWQAAPGGTGTFVEKAGDTMLGHLALVEDPSDVDAVRKDYVDNAIATNVPPPPDLSGYLPLAGGTMTGKLTANGGLSLGSAISASAVDVSRHIDLYGGSYGISITDGTVNLVAGSVASLSVAAGGVTSGPHNVNGDLTASGSLWAGSGHVFYRGNGGIYHMHDGTNFNVYGGQWLVHSNIVGYGDVSASGNLWTGATVYYRGNGGIYLTHDGSNFVFAGGNITTGNGYYSAYVNSSGDIYAGNNITAANAMYSQWGYTTNGAGGGNPYIVSLSAGNPAWNTCSFQLLHYPGNWAGFNFDIGSGNGTVSFRGGGLAYKSGGQLYWDGSSDARIKDVLGEYKQGLDAVCALDPVRYVYKGNETYVAPSHFSDTLLEKDYPENRAEIEAQPLIAPYVNSPNLCCARDRTEYVGLVAQQAETVMPELIRLEKGFIDGVEVDDVRQVNYTPLMFAFVNAFKEMRERIEVLEALLAKTAK